MIILNLIFFLAFFLILMKCAEYAIKYSSRLAKILKFPEFIISFFIIAFISILPESTISIISAFEGEPGLGLGTLLGSNIVDLTLIFGIVVLFSSKKIKVRSKVLKNEIYYLILLSLPLILGFDGKFSRIDGGILVLLGLSFLIKTYIDNRKFHKKLNYSDKKHFFKNLFLLILCFVVILLSAYLTVKFAVNFAHDINLPAIVIGSTILALGTCLPELMFSIKAVRKNHNNLALGDILGTVIIDATIILGIVILISPFNYNPYNIYIIGTALFLAGLLVTIFMKSEKSISKKEGVLLILAYILFVFFEFFIYYLP